MQKYVAVAHFVLCLNPRESFYLCEPVLKLSTLPLHQAKNVKQSLVPTCEDLLDYSVLIPLCKVNMFGVWTRNVSLG